MSEELKPCPFCGGRAWLESNRDWHRVKCDHNGNCIIDEFEPMYSGHEQGKGWIIQDWNQRANPEAS